MKNRRILFMLFVALSVFFSLNNMSHAESKKSALLERITQNKKIVIGVKTDFEPFGFTDSAGKVVGFEIDLAKKIASKIGVDVEIVGVTTSNRFQRLEQGAIDMVIATAADTRERRKIATAIEPGYFGAGVNVMLRPEENVESWEELRSKKLCGLEGAYFNKGITSRYVIDLKVFKSLDRAKAALSQGVCAGLLYSEAAIIVFLSKPEFKDYKYNLSSALTVPWAAYLPRTEKNTNFEFLIGEIIANLHRENYLIELAGRWGIKKSNFLYDTQTLWTTTYDGKLICDRDQWSIEFGDGSWPVECREKAFITSADVVGLNSIFLYIEEKTGLNFSFIYDKFDRSNFLKGILNSILLIVISTLLTIILGIIGAKISSSKFKLIRLMSRTLITILSSTPPLIYMYLIFFGIGALVYTNYNINISAFWTAILGLSLYHGAIITKIFNESINVQKISNEAYSFSLKEIPNIVEDTSGAVNNIIENLVKSSMLASAIAVPELLSATMSIITNQGNTNVMMILLFLLFLTVTPTWLFCVKKIQSSIIKKYGTKNG